MKKFFFISLLFVLSCGSEDSGVDPSEACSDMAHAFGNLCERCDAGSYSECYGEFMQLVSGSCSNVQQVRDADLFYAFCLPWFQTVDCAYVRSQSFELDSSCQGQLLI